MDEFVTFVLGLFARLIVALVYMDVTRFFVGVLSFGLVVGLYLAAVKTVKK